MNNELIEPTVQDITRRAATIAQRPLTPPTEAELLARLHTDEQVITALRAQVADLTAVINQWVDAEENLWHAAQGNDYGASDLAAEEVERAELALFTAVGREYPQ